MNPSHSPAVWGTATFATDASASSRVVSNSLTRLPYKNFSGPLSQAYDVPSSFFSAPQDGLYEISASTNFASRSVSTAALKTAYVYYFVNQTPVFASAQLVAGNQNTQVSSVSNSQLLELKAGDAVYVCASVPDTSAVTSLPNFFSSDPQDVNFISACWLTVQFLGPSSSPDYPWFRALDLQASVALSPNLQAIPFSSSTGPLAQSLDPVSSTFSATAGGLYEFSASVSLLFNNNTSFTAYVFLLVNGLPVWLCPQIVGGAGGVESFVSTASFTQILVLQEGDAVNVGASYPSGPTVLAPPVQVYSQLSPSALQTNPLCLTWWTAQFLQGPPQEPDCPPVRSCPPPVLLCPPVMPCNLAPSAVPCWKYCDCSSSIEDVLPPAQEETLWFTATPLSIISFAPVEDGVLVSFPSCTGPLSASFDAAASFFYAPVSGAYKMSATLSFSSPQTPVDTIQANFVVNDKAVTTSDQIYGGSSGGVISSVTILNILDLSAGDRVLLTASLVNPFPCNILVNQQIPGYSLPVPVTWWTARLL